MLFGELDDCHWNFFKRLAAADHKRDSQLGKRFGKQSKIVQPKTDFAFCVIVFLPLPGRYDKQGHDTFCGLLGRVIQGGIVGYAQVASKPNQSFH